MGLEELDGVVGVVGAVHEVGVLAEIDYAEAD